MQLFGKPGDRLPGPMKFDALPTGAPDTDVSQRQHAIAAIHDSSYAFTRMGVKACRAATAW